MTTLRKYKIKIKGEDGQPSSKEIEGTQVGPFAVSRDPDQFGDYRLTHLFTGLAIMQLDTKDRDALISAAKELSERVKFWDSASTQRICTHNDLERYELKEIIIDIGLKHGIGVS